MVDKLIVFIQEYKTVMAKKGLDFDADKPAQYKLRSFDCRLRLFYALPPTEGDQVGHIDRLDFSLLDNSKLFPLLFKTY